MGIGRSHIFLAIVRTSLPAEIKDYRQADIQPPPIAR
jgi:hypothetical protein